MANFIQHVRPSIADVRCQKIRFLPGDRVLVRVYAKLDDAQQKKLRQSIEKWAGCPVEVLIYNGLQMEISVEQINELPRNTD
jgi:hypothetical protein